MVQVDVFWSYAMGAGFAAAASRQLVDGAKLAVEQGRPDRLYENRYFTTALVYLAALFVPSGVGLVWAFPSWETMHAGDRDLPTWIVMLFAMTNVTQGMLGFWLTRKLLLAGKDFLAALQMVIGYFGMFFILVHGWDGTGYRRFFSATREDFLAWKFTNIFHFLVSDVALTLYGMGLVLLPVMLGMMGLWLVNAGGCQAGSNSCPWRAAGRVAKVILGGSLGLAILASVLMHLLGGLLGVLAFAVCAYFLALRKGALVRGWLAEMMLREKGSL